MRITNLLRALLELLDEPRKVFVICTVLLVVGLVFDGSLFRLYGFYVQEDRLHAQIEATENELVSLKNQLTQARDPKFIDRLARERFTMVAEDELIFLFDE